MKKIDKIIERIELAEYNWLNAKNNLQYIKALEAMLYWMNKLDDELTDEQKRIGEYSGYYLAYFFENGFYYFCLLYTSPSPRDS